MVVKNIEEIFEDDSLVAEVFSSQESDLFFSEYSDLYAVLFKEGVFLHQGFKPPMPRDDYYRIKLQDGQLGVVSDAIYTWLGIKDDLWGEVRVVGFYNILRGYYYYPPRSGKKIFTSGGIGSFEPEPGQLEKRFKRGDLEFVLTRFDFTIIRADEQAIFRDDQIPLVGDLFKLYERKRDRYETAGAGIDCLKLLKEIR